MTTQGITTDPINFLGRTNGANNNYSSKNVSSGGDFSDYLNSNMKSERDVKTDRENRNPKVTYAKDKSTAVEKDTSKTAADNKQPDSVKDTQKQDKVDDTQNVTEKVKKLTDKIESAVKEKLGLTDKELSDLLGLLGMQMTDLLDLDNLKLLALAANGETDITAFLTNEKLSVSFEQLLLAMEQIKPEEFGVTKEDFAAVLNTENAQTETQPELVQTVETQGTNEKAAEKPVILNAEGKIQNPLQSEVKTETTESKTFAETEDNSIKFQADKISDQTADSKSDSKGSSGRNQTNGSMVDTSLQANQFVSNLAEAAGRSADNFVEQLAAARQTRAIVNQIVDEIKVSVKPTATSMELQLNPASLGKVNLTVASKDGVLTAQFLVQNAAAKEAIESQLQSFRENLNNQGVKVEAIEVTVSDFSFAQSNQADADAKEQKRSHRSGGFKEDAGLEGFNAEKENAADMMQIKGSTVEYTA